MLKEYGLIPMSDTGEYMEQNTVEQNVMEQKPIVVHVKFDLNNVFKRIIPPALFALSVVALIKTDGKCGEINTAVGAFTILSFFRCLF